jgi:hypothetical protein
MREADELALGDGQTLRAVEARRDAASRAPGARVGVTLPPGRCTLIPA